MATQNLLDIDVAQARIRASLPVVAATTEQIPLTGASGRIAAENVHAPMDSPPFAASVMDGYAIATQDPAMRGDPPYRLRVEGAHFAGSAAPASLAKDHACRIFTGAPLPARADAVVAQEDCDRDGDDVIVGVAAVPGQHVRPIGHDVAAGDLLVPAGTRLDAFQLARLATCGITRVAVRSRLRVALFVTGNELRDPGTALALGEIYESNRLLVRELLSSMPIVVHDLGIVGDDPAAIRTLLTRAAQEADVILTSGGVSVGDADFVRDAVEALGSLTFWRLAIKPGKPIAHGRIGNAVFFGLPGNPVSTAVTLLLIVKPALWQLAGSPPQPPIRMPARLATRIEHVPGRAEFQRGRVEQRTAGAVVDVCGNQSSSRIGSFDGANCLICIPRDAGAIDAGSTVDVLLLHGLLA
jgi:molybdopterin molybdotransferase